MPFQYVRISMSASGASINTAFSAIATSINAAYHFYAMTESPTKIGFALASSAPTATIADQFVVPASGAIALDAAPGEFIASPTGNMNLYARCDVTSVVSGTLIVFLKG